MPNVSKFSFQEIFSNDNGKSSGSGFAGVVICTIGAICFLMGVVDKMFLSHTPDVMNSTIGFVTLGAGLLGVRKFMNNKNPTADVVDTTVVDTTTTVAATTVTRPSVTQAVIPPITTQPVITPVAQPAVPVKNEVAGNTVVDNPDA